jgi:thiamine-phosphate pyrophosphorylase
VSLIQLREKVLSTRVLQELAANAVELTRDTQTRLLINERFDMALAVGADGVQLTSQSMPVDVVRRIVGNEFLIGVSTHSLAEAVEAKAGGADFVLFGPVYETESKRAFGPPQGIASLRQVAGALKSFPVIAIGGINTSNARDCLAAGAVGVAAISMFEDPDALESIITAMS